MNLIDAHLLSAIQKQEKKAFVVSQWLTEHPEIGGEEKESSAYLIRFLKEQGYEVEAPLCDLPYSFRAYRPSDKPRVALLCEYDALPEIGHGCGHSLSCAISILSALAIADTYEDFPFSVDLIGTPGEETIGGKVILAKQGVFDKYEFAIMGHIDSINAPQIRVLASNDMYITIHGTGAHASTAPWKGASALNAAQLFMHAVDLNRTHYKPFMQMHGIIVEGGEAPNTIPDKIVLDYYPRAASMNDLNLLRQQTIRALEGGTHATGTTFTLEQRYDTFSELFYGPTAVKLVTDIFEALGQTVEPMEYPEGSTDAGNVDLVIPTFHLEIKGSDTYVNFHTREFERLMYGARAEKTLLEGAGVIASVISHLAFNKPLLEQIKQEHKDYRSKQ